MIGPGPTISDRRNNARATHPIEHSGFDPTHLADAATESLNTIGTEAISPLSALELHRWHTIAPAEINEMFRGQIKKSPELVFWLAGFPYKHWQSTQLRGGDTWVHIKTPDVAVLRGPSIPIPTGNGHAARLYTVPLLINTLILSAAIFPGLTLAHQHRRRRRIARHLCPECTYPATTPICPECGQPTHAHRK